jgi:hypothetical protein
VDFPRGIKACDQAAHAGTGNVVDRSVVFFKPLEHPDMCQTKRAPSLQRHADLWARPGSSRCGWRFPRRFRLGWLLVRSRLRAHEKGQP